MAGVNAVLLDGIRHEPVVPCGVVKTKEVKTIGLGAGHRHCMGQRMNVHVLIITHQVQMSTVWQGLEESNLPVWESKAHALTTWLNPYGRNLIQLAGADGFEPPFHESESSALTAVLRP